MQFINTYQSLPEVFYKPALPSVAVQPQVVLFNHQLATELNIQLSENQITDYLSGLALPQGAKPIAQAYAGHQFGHFNMLGDGRAILLGEIKTPTNTLMDVQLKGAGATEYSRRGDGKLALSSALREYIYSECMHTLGIASTLSLAVVATGAPVYRQQAEPGAVLTRLAQSHIRVGTFEYASRYCNSTDLQHLVSYAVNRHYPHLQHDPNVAVALLKAVTMQQMQLVVQWMRVGFIHGVLNTDNVSIACETIDYGPCAFMNEYNPAKVYSQIDKNGRYAFGQQPQITHWNMTRFAESLLPLLHPDKNEAIAIATQILNETNLIFEKKYIEMLHAKIGITQVTPHPIPFIGKLLQWMHANNADYTNTFLYLMNKNLPNNELYSSSDWKELVQEWKLTLQENNISMQAALATMQQHNPNYIPRNTHVENLINDCLETGSVAPIEHFLLQMKSTYQTDCLHQELFTYPAENNYNTHCNT
jgi:serine/tyrosine/threonine adenylyltransferase